MTPTREDIDAPRADVPTNRTDSLPNERVIAGLVLFITAALYAATLRFQFVYDDQGQIVENALVHSWRFVPQYFKGQVWVYLFPNAPANYYRPLNVLWFRVNDALFGLHPAGWHAMSILLHVLATFLVYALARRVTGRPLVAALSALLFGVHPMRHEVVAWVSGTTESLWSVLFLAGFLAYLKSRERNRAGWLVLSCAFYAAGLFSKETAIMLPAIVFAHAWIYGGAGKYNARDSGGRRIWPATKLALVYVPVAIAYLAVRISVLHGFEHTQRRMSLTSFVWTLPSVVFFYFRQWLMPIRFAEFYDLPIQSRFGFVHVALPVLGLAVIAILLWSFRHRLGVREVNFSAAWMILLLLPVFDLPVFSAGELVHDRYFYLPGFGACLIVAIALSKLAYGSRVFGLPRRLVFVTLALLAPLCYSTANAASYWMDNYVLFEHAIRVAPLNITARNNYAVASAGRGDFFTALRLLHDILNEQPNNWLANYNFGRVSYQMGQLAGAEHYFERAQRIDPAMPDTYLQLALIDVKSHRSEEAEANIRRGIALRPYEPSFRFALGVVLASKVNCSEARKEFAEALVLKPGLAQAREQMEKCGTPAKAQDAPAAINRSNPEQPASPPPKLAGAPR